MRFCSLAKMRTMTKKMNNDKPNQVRLMTEKRSRAPVKEVAAGMTNLTREDLNQLLDPMILTKGGTLTSRRIANVFKTRDS